jgi:hypothetical protein
MYYDTGTNKLYWWNGTIWVDSTGGGGASGSTKYSYTYSASTGTPNSGEVRLDAALGSATKLRAHQTSLGTLTMYDLEAHAKPGSVVLMATSNRSYSLFMVTTSAILAGYLELGVTYLGSGDIGDAAAGTVNLEVDPGYVLPSGGTAGQVLTKSSATNYAASWQGGVAAVGMPYTYAGSTATPPNAGEVRFDSSTVTARTKMWLSATDANGVNRKLDFWTLMPGQTVTISMNDRSRYQNYQLLGGGTNYGGGIVDNSTWFEIPIGNSGGGVGGMVPGPVTVWFPPAVTDVTYNGAYATPPTATAYTDGDIVIYNGVAWMCVRPTVNPPATWPSQSVTTYGTNLPTSPVDGQRFVLVDSVTNPVFQWEFRYNASSTSTYKWEFVGGAPLSAEDPTGQGSITSTSYVSTGDQITVSRAGDYILEYGLFMTNNTAQNYTYMAAKIGAAAVSDDNGVFVASSFASGYGYAFFKRRINAIPASTLISFWTHVSAGTGAFGRLYIHLTPVRIT